MEEMITITKKEYDDLRTSQYWLQCLEEAGVDNWEGISYAYDLKEDGK
jgi:hypothetical protein